MVARPLADGNRRASPHPLGATRAATRWWQFPSRESGDDVTVTYPFNPAFMPIAE